MDENAQLKEITNLLAESKYEILGLRKANQEQAGRLQMFDDCMLLLNARQPNSCVGFSEDVVQKIDRKLAALNKGASNE